MSLIAPRGLMLSTAVTESASNIFGIEQAYHSTKNVYEFLDAEENIAIASRYGLHGVNANDIEGYVDFFDFVFHRTDRAPENRLFYNYTFDEWRASNGDDVNPLDHGRTVINLDTYTSSGQQWKEGKQTVIETYNGCWAKNQPVLRIRVPGD